jgi:hypothetical protein
MENKENYKIEINQAKPEDARGVIQVFYQTWLDTYPNEELSITKEDIEDRFLPRLSEEGVAKMAEKISHPKPDTLFLVVRDGDKIVGVCRVRKGEDQNELEAIYVLPQYQRLGLGHKLWQEVNKFFDPDKDVIVKVATYNQKAISFYSKLGFVDTNKRFAEEKFRLKSGAIIPEMEMIIKRSKGI